MKKIIAGTCAMLALASSMFAAPKKGTVRYLNFKPEVASIYQELAAEYEKETGVKVIVETAANNAYESTLATKMSTKQAPTLFQINGPRGYANWADYCADLSETELYKHLTDKSLAVTNKGKVYKLIVDDIPVGTNSSVGTPLNSLIEFENGEEAQVIYSLYRNTEDKYVLFTTKNGLIKKIA